MSITKYEAIAASHRRDGKSHICNDDQLLTWYSGWAGRIRLRIERMGLERGTIAGKEVKLTSRKEFGFHLPRGNCAKCLQNGAPDPLISLLARFPTTVNQYTIATLLENKPTPSEVRLLPEPNF